MSKIMIVDDDKNICRLLELYLREAGHAAVCCHDGSTALDLLKAEKPDLVLLDLMIPTINGWEVCKLLKLEEDVPVIIVSARDAIEDKLAGFDAGADDYIVKPFDPQEMVARVKARLRARETTRPSSAGILCLYNLQIDLQRYEVRLDGRGVELKPKELQLLHFLARHKNMVFTRDQLLEKLWGYAQAGDTRTVDVHIKALRDKLDPGGAPWQIKTVWGVGYKLEAD